MTVGKHCRQTVRVPPHDAATALDMGTAARTIGKTDRLYPKIVLVGCADGVKTESQTDSAPAAVIGHSPDRDRGDAP